MTVRPLRVLEHIWLGSSDVCALWTSEELGGLTAVCIRAALAVHRSLRLIQSRLDAFSAASGDVSLLAQLLCSHLHPQHSKNPNERAAGQTPFIHPPSIYPSLASSIMLGPPSIQPTQRPVNPDRSTCVVVAASSTTSGPSAAAAMFSGNLSDISGSTFRRSGAVASSSPARLRHSAALTKVMKSLTTAGYDADHIWAALRWPLPDHLPSFSLPFPNLWYGSFAAGFRKCVPRLTS